MPRTAASPCRCDCGLTEIPAFIAQSFDQPLLFDDNGGRRYYVTLGQFSLVRLGGTPSC